MKLQLNGLGKNVETDTEAPYHKNGAVVIRLCETERRREACALPRLKRMLTTVRDHPPQMDTHANGCESERLPVVELRPFIKKQWRPAKSIPSPTYSDPPLLTNSYTPHGLSRSKTEPSLELHGYIDRDKKASITSPRQNDIPCPRAFTVSGERTCYHPRSRQPMGQSMPTPLGFVSKPERERSTLEDIRSGTSHSVQFSCVKSALNDAEVEYQQGIKVHGTRVNLPPRSSSMYLRPWEYYHQKQKCRPPDTGLIDSIYRTLEQFPDSCLDDIIYDAFDRSYTLPSMNVHPARVKKRPDPTRFPSGVQAPHRLGVTNSLDLLSHYGTPINMEQHLTDQLKNTINNIRRSKPMSISSLKAVKNSDWNPTQGEQQIYTKRLANTSCSSRSPTTGPRSFCSGRKSEAQSRKLLDVSDSMEEISPTHVEVRKSKLHDAKVSGSRIGDHQPASNSKLSLHKIHTVKASDSNHEEPTEDKAEDSATQDQDSIQISHDLNEHATEDSLVSQPNPNQREDLLEASGEAKLNEEDAVGTPRKEEGLDHDTMISGDPGPNHEEQNA